MPPDNCAVPSIVMLSATFIASVSRSLQIVQVNDVAAVASTLTRGLRAAGHDARFVELAKYGARWPYPWKAAAFPARFASLAVLGLRLRLSAADLVHVHYASQAILGRLSGRPYVVHCHGTDIRSSTPRTRWGRAIAPGLANAAGVLYSTPDLEPWARTFRRDASFLPNPIDTDQFRPGQADTVTDVLISTRLDALKGADAILETVAVLRRLRPRTTFTVVDHGSRRGELRKTVGTAAQFVDPLAHDRMPALLARHSIFLGQFGLGTIGQAEFEALACGIPAVARLLDPSQFEDPPPIVNAPNGATAAREIADLLDAPDDRAALALKSRNWVVRHRSVPVVVGLLLDRYAEFGIGA